MDTLNLVLLSLAVVLLTVGLIVRHRTRSLRAEFANIGEGVHDDGKITQFTDTAIAERYLLVKRGAAANTIAICGAADTPIGSVEDEASAAGEPVTLRRFCSPGTRLLIASASIADGALLEPAANGRVATLGGGAGTHHVVGRAMHAQPNVGEPVEVDTTYFLRVI